MGEGVIKDVPGQREVRGHASQASEVLHQEGINLGRVRLGNAGRKVPPQGAQDC